jgi:hypothetical protein
MDDIRKRNWRFSYWLSSVAFQCKIETRATIKMTRYPLVAYLNDACRHTALIDVSNYPAETEVPAFSPRVKCGKCGSRDNKIDVRPNWKEQPTGPSLTGAQWR